MAIRPPATGGHSGKEEVMGNEVSPFPNFMRLKPSEFFAALEDAVVLYAKRAKRDQPHCGVAFGVLVELDILLISYHGWYNCPIVLLVAHLGYKKRKWWWLPTLWNAEYTLRLRSMQEAALEQYQAICLQESQTAEAA